MKNEIAQAGVSGFVQPRFEAVREAFIENFRRNELGAACCIYYQGEKVVDLWGGIRNKATGEPWEEDTMVCVFSLAKGMAGLAMALAHSRGLLDYEERVYARNLENPSGNGVGTARAIARAYSVFASGGGELALRQETLKALMAPATPPLHGFYDEVMKKEMCFSLGFLKPNRTYPFGNVGAFGEPGHGGSFAFADPEAGLGYAYVTNQMGARMGGDPRDVALREAVHRTISQPTTQTRVAG